MAEPIGEFTEPTARLIYNTVMKILANNPALKLRKYPGAEARSVGYIFKAPAGGIPAISGSTLGSAACTPYYINSSGSRTERKDSSGSSQTFTVYNQFSTAVSADAYFVAIWCDGKYIAINDDCA